MFKLFSSEKWNQSWMKIWITSGFAEQSLQPSQSQRKAVKWVNITTDFGK